MAGDLYGGLGVSLRSLLTQEVVVVAPGTTRDELNNEVDDWVNAQRRTWRGLLQQTATQEIVVGGDRVFSDWLLWLVPEADIRARHRIEEGVRTFEVVGAPALEHRRGRPHHWEARLVLRSG